MKSKIAYCKETIPIQAMVRHLMPFFCICIWFAGAISILGGESTDIFTFLFYSLGMGSFWYLWHIKLYVIVKKEKILWHKCLVYTSPGEKKERIEKKEGMVRLWIKDILELREIIRGLLRISLFLGTWIAVPLIIYQHGNALVAHFATKDLHTVLVAVVLTLLLFTGYLTIYMLYEFIDVVTKWIPHLAPKWIPVWVYLKKPKEKKA